MNEWFVINDLNEFTDKTRIIVYNNFGKWESNNPINDTMDLIEESDTNDMNKVLSHEESLTIVKQVVKKQKHKKSDRVRYILNETLFAKIVQDLNARMVSNVLNELVKKDIIESGFDNESNDFVFWIKKDNNETPETD
jgi:hypothetical protein